MGRNVVLQGNSVSSQILLSAYSMAPRQGSEPGIGLAAARGLAVLGQTTALVAGHYRKSFAAADLEQLKAIGVDVHFRTLDRFAFLRRLKPQGLWSNVYYYLWQKRASGWLRALPRAAEGAIAVHMTWAKGTTTPAVAGCGLPFVIGPVGGFEQGYPQLEGLLPWRLGLLERARRVAIENAMRSKRLASAYRRAQIVYANNEESKHAIAKISGRSVNLMTNCGVVSSDFERLGQPDAGRGRGNVFRAAFAGRLVGWKGEALALKALAGMRSRQWEFIVLGDGPARKDLEQLAADLGVRDRVKLAGSVAQSEVHNVLRCCDVFLFPSYHDSGGTAVLEAMAAGLPVVCLRAGGPGYYVNEECGFPVQAVGVELTTHRLTSALDALRSSPELRRTLGWAARERVRIQFTWEARDRRLLRELEGLLKSRDCRNRIG